MTPVIKRTVFVLVTIVFYFMSCEKKKGDVPPKSSNCKTSFTDSVYPIISVNCAQNGCHTSGAQFGDFTSYGGIKPKVDNGKFYKLVIETRTMPPGFSLTDQQLQTLKCWLDNGATNN